MKRVLLADDDPALRSALALLLETRLGVRVIGGACSMGELLEAVTRLHPEAVVLDWELPGEPRQGRVAALRQVEPGVRVIIISAWPESAAAARAAEADAFVNKTDPPEVILNLFREEQAGDAAR